MNIRSLLRFVAPLFLGYLLSCERSANRPAADGAHSGPQPTQLPADAKLVTTAASAAPLKPSVPAATGWLNTERNRIVTSDGKPFRGRGANLFDTRQCGSCGWAEPHVDEVIRRVDELVDGWHANLIRLALTSFPGKHFKGMDLAQWGDVTQDARYLAELKKIVAHIGQKPGVYVMITLFDHPTITKNGIPTEATDKVYEKLVEVFKNDAHVWFGVCNEPHDTTDEEVWNAMNHAVETIRKAETKDGPRHIVAVQGTQKFARMLDYYLGKRISAGEGKNVVYETHVYDHPPAWQSMFVGPSNFIPVIIGEYGPADGYMTIEDSKQLMLKAEELEVPYIAWSFSPQCLPGLIKAADNPTDCGVGLPLVPSEWGSALKAHLEKPW